MQSIVIITSTIPPYSKANGNEEGLSFIKINAASQPNRINYYCNYETISSCSILII